MSLLNRKNKDEVLRFTLSFSGYFTSLIVFIMLAFLFKESLSVILSESDFFSLKGTWYPTELKFNLFSMVIGSILVTIGSVIIALPLGLYSAIFISFYCPYHLKWSLTRLIELYTGVPSVIFGFWGLIKLVPLINEFHPPGQSFLAAIIILSLMIFPIISLSLITSFQIANRQYLKVSESLGLRKCTHIWKILIPSIKGQALGATILAFGRAAGETMAVLMVSGNIVKIPDSLFSPVRTLTANIALEMSYAMGEHRSSLFFSGLILFILIAVIFSLGKIIERRG